jgi:hypothetical protein
MADRPTIESIVFQGCPVHRGYNVKLCVGCVDASLQRLAQAVEAIVQILEERLDIDSEAIEGALEEG